MCSTSKGASADLGKTAGKDAAAGKPTYPALYGLEHLETHGRTNVSSVRPTRSAPSALRIRVCCRSAAGSWNAPTRV